MNIKKMDDKPDQGKNSGESENATSLQGSQNEDISGRQDADINVWKISKEKWEAATRTVIEKVVHDRPKLHSAFDHRSLETCSSDVLVCSYPKSGAEVLRVIIMTMIRFTNRPRAPSITSTTNEEYRLEVLEPDIFSILPRPRILYTNLRYQNLPKGFKGKVVYVIRNPKSAAVELYNSTYVDQDKISFKAFASKFLDSDDQMFHYKTHVIDFIDNEQKLKILAVKFEDIEKRPGPLFNMLSRFLGLRGLTNREGLEILRRIELAQTRGRLIGKSLANWHFVAKGIRSENFMDYFDKELTAKFNTQLKTDWKIVSTAEC